MAGIVQYHGGTEISALSFISQLSLLYIQPSSQPNLLLLEVASFRGVILPHFGLSLFAQGPGVTAMMKAFIYKLLKAL